MRNNTIMLFLMGSCLSLVGPLGCHGLFPALVPTKPGEVVAFEKRWIARIHQTQERSRLLVQIQQQIQESLRSTTGASAVECAAIDEDASIEGQEIPAVSLHCVLVGLPQRPQSSADMKELVEKALKETEAEIVGGIWLTRDNDEWVVITSLRRTAKDESISAPRQ